MLVESRVSRRPLEQELISRGVRMTHQRRLLVHIIQSADRHLDALDLWQKARQQDSTLNKVTVYRTLALLKKHGLVDELDLLHLQGGRHYYEARTTRDHIHLACLKCGRIQEFESSLFEKLKGQIERERRFRITVVRVEAGHQRRPRQEQGSVERPGQAGARLPFDPQPRLAEGAQEISRPVGRSVVDHDELEVGQGLPEHARRRRPDPVHTVVDRHEHGDGRGRRGPVTHPRPF